MVLDVNFNNPYKTADFLFFDDKEDAKKTDNNVVKVKGCLILCLNFLQYCIESLTVR